MILFLRIGKKKLDTNKANTFLQFQKMLLKNAIELDIVGTSPISNCPL
jgi:hypothetical protein